MAVFRTHCGRSPGRVAELRRRRRRAVQTTAGDGVAAPPLGSHAQSRRVGANGLDTVGLGIVAADLGAEITDVETVEVGGRDILEASAETKTARVKIGVVSEGTNVLALVVTTPEGSGSVLRAAEQSLSFAPSPR